MATDISWTVHTDSETFTVASVVADTPNIVIGERMTIRVRPVLARVLYVAAGETHTVESGTTETYTKVIVDGTLNVDGTLVVDDLIGGLKPYLNYAGQAATYIDIDSQPAFREQLPSDARVTSIVLGFEPSSDLTGREVNGVWGLVMGAADRRNNTLTETVFEFDLWVLARFSDYASVTAVKNDLEA